MIETGMLSDEQCRDVLNWLIDHIGESGRTSDAMYKDRPNTWDIAQAYRCKKIIEECNDEVKRIVYGTED